MKYLVYILNLLLFIVSIFLLINGSLEMYPTNEQQKKIKTIGFILLIISLIPSIFYLKKISAGGYINEER